MKTIVDLFVQYAVYCIIAVSFLIWPALIIAKFYKKRNRKKESNHRKVHAKCILKECWLDEHVGVEIGIVMRDDKFRLVFSFEDEEKTFVVSKLVYDCVEEGDEGLLEYSIDEIVSFSDKIKKYED